MFYQTSLLMQLHQTALCLSSLSFPPPKPCTLYNMILADDSCTIRSHRAFRVWYQSQSHYSAGHSNSTTLLTVPTFIFVKIQCHHCVQNSKIHLKTHFSGFSHDFLRVANFFGPKFQHLIPDLGGSDEPVLPFTWSDRSECHCTLNTTLIVVLPLYIHPACPSNSLVYTILHLNGPSNSSIFKLRQCDL